MKNWHDMIIKRLIFISAALVLLALACAQAGDSTDSIKEKPPEQVKILDSKTGEVILMDKVIKTDAEWKEILSPEAFKITRRKGTERAFTSEFHDKKDAGTYKCVGCGTELFSTDTKFDSGTGWPSYYEPISEHNVKSAPDNSLFMKRTEVLCARCDAHLGHVFGDGPKPTGQRYCINGLALTFEPK